MKRKKKTNQNKMYFTAEHEQAILKFCNSEDHAEKEKLYIQIGYNRHSIKWLIKLYFPINLQTYQTLMNCRMECKVWLTTILDKYDPNRGSKGLFIF